MAFRKDLLEEIKSLPVPSVLESKTYDVLLLENVEKLKDYLPNYQPLESDRYMKDLRVLTYKQYQNQIGLNHLIKQMLITLATGEMLDHLTLFLGVERLKGSKPYATYIFKLVDSFSYDIVIPKNTELKSDDGLYLAHVVADVVIEAGNKEGEAVLELDYFLESTEAITNIITTPLPFVLSATSKEKYSNGSTSELDDALRVRAIRSLGKFSTAGSVNSYLYWVYSSDSRIDDCVVYGKEGTLEVNVFIHSKSGVDALMIDRVEQSLSIEKVRPLNDDVRVYVADIKKVVIIAEIELYDLYYQNTVDQTIKDNFKKYNFVIGQHLTKTEAIKSLQVKNVYRVNTSYADEVPLKNEVIELSLILSYKRAVNE